MEMTKNNPFVIEMILIAAAAVLDKMVGLPPVIVALIMAGLFIVEKEAEKSIKDVSYATSAILGVSCIFHPEIVNRAVIAAAILAIAIKKNDEKDGTASGREAFAMTNISIGFYAMSIANIYLILFRYSGILDWGFFLIIVIIATMTINHVDYSREKARYDGSQYGKASGNAFDEALKDKGKRGEYQTSICLDDISSYNKVLFNVYIPAKTDAWSMELDSIVISESGIDILEIKNRSVTWKIDDLSSNVTIIYKDGHADTAFNPFRQNKNHIMVFDTFIRKLDEKYGDISGGFVVFGKDTIGWNIKNVDEQGFCDYTSVSRFINGHKNKILSPEDVDRIYNYLLPYQNNEELKKRHEQYYS